MDMDVPGPGLYNVSNLPDNNKLKIKISIKGKNSRNRRSEDSPSPGDYKQIQISYDGKYPISKHSNISSSCFGKQTDTRLKCTSIIFVNLLTEDNGVPGPGYYFPIKNYLSLTNRNIIKTFDNSNKGNTGSRQLKNSLNAFDKAARSGIFLLLIIIN